MPGFLPTKSEPSIIPHYDDDSAQQKSSHTPAASSPSMRSAKTRHRAIAQRSPWHRTIRVARPQGHQRAFSKAPYCPARLIYRIDSRNEAGATSCASPANQSPRQRKMCSGPRPVKFSGGAFHEWTSGAAGKSAASSMKPASARPLRR